MFHSPSSSLAQGVRVANSYLTARRQLQCCLTGGRAGNRGTGSAHGRCNQRSGEDSGRRSCCCRCPEHVQAMVSGQVPCVGL